MTTKKMAVKKLKQANDEIPFEKADLGNGGNGDAQIIKDEVKLLVDKKPDPIAAELGLKEIKSDHPSITLGALKKMYEEMCPQAMSSMFDKESPATILLGIIKSEIKAGRLEVFKAPTTEPFATFQSDESEAPNTAPLDSLKFQSFAKDLYMAETRLLCSTDAVKCVTDYLTGKTKIVKLVYVRRGCHDGCVYIDLANESIADQFIKIGPSDWKQINAKEVPIKFWRPPGMLPQVVPQRGGNLELLRQFINVADDQGFKKLLLFLISTFTDGPQLLLLILGGKGTAKTFSAILIRRLIDPNSADHMGPPDNEQDLLLACRAQLLIVIDNLSKIFDGRSDTHCRIATGAAKSERLLYTNAEQFIFSFRCPQVFTSIKDVVTKTDLADRKMRLELQKIGNNRKTEKKLFAEFEKIRPLVLGALYDAVAGALAELPNVSEKPLPRMADAAQLMFAVEQHLKWKEGTVEKLLADEASADADDMVDGNTFAQLLIKKVQLEGNAWKEVSARTIISALKELAEPEDKQFVPRTERALADKIRELGPDLAIKGLDITHRRNKKKRFYDMFYLEPSETDNNPSQSVNPSPPNTGEDLKVTDRVMDQHDNTLKNESSQEIGNGAISAEQASSQPGSQSSTLKDWFGELDDGMTDNDALSLNSMIVPDGISTVSRKRIKI